MKTENWWFLEQFQVQKNIKNFALFDKKMIFFGPLFDFHHFLSLFSCWKKVEFEFQLNFLFFIFFLYWYFISNDDIFIFSLHSRWFNNWIEFARFVNYIFRFFLLINGKMNEIVGESFSVSFPLVSLVSLLGVFLGSIVWFYYLNYRLQYFSIWWPTLFKIKFF